MNVSNSTAVFSSQSSSTNSRPQGPPPRGEEQLSSALQSIGVDESTTADILAQVDEAIAALKSESTSGVTSRPAMKSVIDDVLEANGIDPSEVEEAIQASGAGRSSGVEGSSEGGGASGRGGPSEAGRPAGPPPHEADSSVVESALLSAGADESSTDELINQIIDSIQELTNQSDSNVSQEELRSILTSLFEENGVDIDQFEQALSEQVGSPGSFLNLLV
ncbi:hypothetical protein N9N28_14320 [Rubripirellula amarantea]|nr:hypothetical protein [Rubripirellula amarantea]